MSRKTKINVDPLFQLFEEYLVNRSYDDAAAFTKQLARDYLAYLDSTPAHVPMHLRASVLEDLEHESHEMLVKKMYGVVCASDYQNFGKVLKETKEESLDWVDLKTALSSDDDQPKD